MKTDPSARLLREAFDEASAESHREVISSSIWRRLLDE